MSLLLMFVFSESKYEWMADIDPSAPPASIELASDNRSIFLVLLLVIAIASQLVILIKSSQTKDKLISTSLILTIIIIHLK